MASTVTLRTTDVTSHIVEDSLQPGIHDLWAHVRIAAVRFKSTLPNRPEPDDFLKITKTDGTGAAFSGVLRMPDTIVPVRVAQEYDVAAQGWEALLDGLNITTGMNLAVNYSDANLVNDALTTFYSQIATTGFTHRLYPAANALPFKRVPPGIWSFRQLMDWIVKQTGAPWWIDPLDKSFHYNDFEVAAPWILSDSPNGTTKRGWATFARRKDNVGRAIRVTVTDGGVNSFTATDWEAYADLVARTPDEPGAPGDRFPQLPDHADSALDTDAKRQRRAYALLEAEKGRTIISATVKDEGLEIGQMLDVINSTIGTETSPHPSLEQWELGVTSTTEDLDTGMGRFMVSKVTPRSLGRDLFLWDIEAGDPSEIAASVIARSSER